MKRLKKWLRAWLWPMLPPGADPSIDGPSLKERLDRVRYEAMNGGPALRHIDEMTSMLKESEKMGLILSRKDLEVVLWSLDYHWHRITAHGKGNTSMEQQVDRMRRQLREHMKTAFYTPTRRDPLQPSVDLVNEVPQI